MANAVFKGMTAQSIIEGVELFPLSDLPLIWQQIADGQVKVGHPDVNFLVELVRVYFAQAKHKDFSRKEVLISQNFHETKAIEMLTFLGDDYKIKSYPKWNIELKNAASPKEQAQLVVEFAKDVFGKFGYNFPSSFYRMLLCPIERSNIYDVVALYFDPQTQGVKDIYDPFLHGFSVTGVLMAIQAIASKYGFLIDHGCGCNHKLLALNESNSYVKFEFANEQAEQKAVVAYLWEVMNQLSKVSLQVHSKSLIL